MVSLVFAGVDNTGAEAIVATYEAAIVSAGGTISAAQRAAAKAFVTTGVSAGWWAKIIDCGLFLGSNLAASLVKIKAAAGAGTSLSNHGFLSGDYTATTGLAAALSTTKYLGTGVIPSAQGLSTNNLSYGVGTPDETTWGSAEQSYVNSTILGCNDAVTLNATMVAGPFGGIGGAGATQTWVESYGAGVSFGVNLKRSALDGVGTNDTPNNGSTGNVDAEVTICRLINGGVTYYGGGGAVGFYFIGPTLTMAELRSITAAARQCHVAARDSNFAILDAVIGDSTTSTTWGWPNTVSANRGHRLLNLAISSTEFMRDNVSGFAGKNRLVGINSFTVDTLFINMGTNDLGNGDGTSNGDATLIAAFRAALAAACTTLKGYGIRPVLVSPAWLGYPTQTKLLAYVDAVLGAASDANVIGVDWCRPMIANGVVANPLLYFDAGQAPNYIHPNSDGHALGASLVTAAI